MTYKHLLLCYNAQISFQAVEVDGDVTALGVNVNNNEAETDAYVPIFFFDYTLQAINLPNRIIQLTLEYAMTKKSLSRKKKRAPEKRPAPGMNVLLMLTLVPLVVGVLLISAWALDISILEDAQSQITVGILFFLLSFVASNALQKRWRLAAGWGLLMCADLVILAWLELWAQAVAIALGFVGLIFLAVEFYGQYQQGKVEKAEK